MILHRPEDIRTIRPELRTFFLMDLKIVPFTERLGMEHQGVPYSLLEYILSRLVLSVRLLAQVISDGSGRHHEKKNLQFFFLQTKNIASPKQFHMLYEINQGNLFGFSGSASADTTSASFFVLCDEYIIVSQNVFCENRTAVKLPCRVMSNSTTYWFKELTTRRKPA